MPRASASENELSSPVEKTRPDAPFAHVPQPTVFDIDIRTSKNSACSALPRRTL